MNYQMTHTNKDPYKILDSLTGEEYKSIIDYHYNYKNDYHYVKPIKYQLGCNICGYSEEEHSARDEKTNEEKIKHLFQMSPLESECVQKHQRLLDSVGSDKF